jgi:hypothetical protein
MTDKQPPQTPQTNIQPTDMGTVMASLRIPQKCHLRRKEQFEYITQGYLYDVDLFQNADGTWYSIAVPRDSERLVVYGSSELPSAKLALQSLIDKIKREGMDQLFGDGQLEAEDEDEFEDEYEDDEVRVTDVQADEMDDGT